MRRAFWVVLVAAVVYVLAGAPCANATSDPFTVTAEGVTLTDGTFQANGHVNWRTTLGSGSIHFDPNNGQPGGTYIGASFFPIPLAPGECLVWVQVHPFNYHFGENGEEPVCASTTTPSPTPPTSPTPTPVPESTEEPTPTTSPSPSPPTPTSPPSNPSSPAPTTPSQTPEPQPSPSMPTGIGAPEYPPTSTPTPGSQAPTPTEPAPTTTPREGLAVTGPYSGGLLAALAIIALMAGIAVLTRQKDTRR